jgi:hypothetical protein
MTHMSQRSQRIVTAPPPSPASAKLQPNGILSVVLEADEDVEWIWTHTTDGTSYVSGYEIARKRVP